MGAWDTPPTPEELKGAQADPWATPPTAEEMGRPLAPSEQTDSLGFKVRQFFDPSYPSPSASMGDVGRQTLKAGSFLVPGGTFARGAAAGTLYALSDKDATLASVAGSAAAGGTLGKLIPWLAQKYANLAFPAIKPLDIPLPGAAGKAAGQQIVEQAGESAVPPLAKLVTGAVAPTDDATLLMSKGIRIPRAMQDPGSAANQLEQALQSTHPYGSKIRAQRLTPLDDFRIAAANEARPPGMKPIKIETPLHEAAAQLDEGFKEAYSKVGGVDVYPAVHGPGGGPLQGVGETPGLAERAVDSVKRLQDSQSAAIKRDVADLLSKLPERNGAVGKVEVGDLLGVRSIVRARERGFSRVHNPEADAAAEAYGAVDDVLTAAIESQLPAKTAAYLKSVDGKYRFFKQFDNAMARAAGNDGMFTPRMLASVAGSGERGVRLSEAGPLCDLATAANRVFAETVKPTGERVAILQSAGKFLPNWIPDGVANRVAGHAVVSANEAAMAPASAWRVPTAPSAAVPGVPQSAADLLAPKLGGRIPPAQAGEGRRPEERQQPAQGVASAPAQATPPPPHTSTDAIIQRLEARPDLRGHADLFRKATPDAAASLHRLLYERDPAYRQAMTDQESR